MDYIVVVVAVPLHIGFWEILPLAIAVLVITDVGGWWHVIPVVVRR